MDDRHEEVLGLEIIPEEPEISQTKLDQIDARAFTAPTTEIRRKSLQYKPGKILPSRPTFEKNYDTSNTYLGVALIFNHYKFKSKALENREGTLKDAQDLSEVLGSLGFQVRVYVDLSRSQIQKKLMKVSQEDHSKNDAFLVAVMTHGDSNGQLHALDKPYDIRDLWVNFVGTECLTLVGKPKLFFIQACRGNLVDPGVIFMTKNPKLETPEDLNEISDTVDAVGTFDEEVFVIPTLADILLMYSTVEGYYSFRNPRNGTCFIQALCEVLGENHKEHLLNILTFVNSKVAYGFQSSMAKSNEEWDATKQMPSIVSMLTKSFYFTKKSEQLTRKNNSIINRNKCSCS